MEEVEVVSGITPDQLWRAIAIRATGVRGEKLIGRWVELPSEFTVEVVEDDRSLESGLLISELRRILDREPSQVIVIHRAGINRAGYPNKSVWTAVDADRRWAVVCRVRAKAPGGKAYRWPERTLEPRVVVDIWRGDPEAMFRRLCVEGLGIVPQAVKWPIDVSPDDSDDQGNGDGEEGTGRRDPFLDYAIDPRWRSSFKMPTFAGLAPQLIRMRLDDPDALVLQITWRGIGFDERGSMPSVYVGFHAAAIAFSL